MTLTRAQPTTTAAPDAEALIEEARRRQRARRGRMVALIVAAALVASGLGYLVSGAGGASGSSTSEGGSGATPAVPPQARWKELAANGLPPGSQVTSVTSYDGQMVAAGQYFSNGGPAPAGYPAGVSPIVWTSTNGASWTLAWQPGGIELGSGEVPHLVATTEGLFLFVSGTGGSALWRSGDGVSFVRQTLPEGMAGRMVETAVFGHGRLVVTEPSNGAGGPADAGADVVWTSADGVQWEQGVVPAPQQMRFASLAVTSSGFLLGSQATSTKRPTIWTSRDGRTWGATTTLAGPRSSVEVAADGANMVAVGVWGRTTPLVVWSSHDGMKWTRSDTTIVSGTYTGERLFAVSGGFAIISHPPTGSSVALWYSATGAHWSVLHPHGAPPDSPTVTSFFPDSAGLLGVTGSTGSGKAVNFWQITVTSPR